MDLPLMEEDKVVYLLASLPESFGVLVTTLEACPDVPTMDVVTQRLLHQERGGVVDEKEKALAMKSKHPKKRGPCHHCGKMGHYTGSWLRGRLSLRRRTRVASIRPA